MPLLKFHIFKGWKRDDVARLLKVSHTIMVEAFQVPAADRYQIVQQHKTSHMHALDTGLGIPRTKKFVLLEVVSRPRGRDAKVAFYQNLASALQARCGIAASDLMVSFVENGDEDWSFGFGRAQFLTGELGSGSTQDDGHAIPAKKQ